MGIWKNHSSGFIKYRTEKSQFYQFSCSRKLWECRTYLLWNNFLPIFHCCNRLHPHVSPNCSWKSLTWGVVTLITGRPTTAVCSQHGQWMFMVLVWKMQFNNYKHQMVVTCWPVVHMTVEFTKNNRVVQFIEGVKRN